MDPQKWLSVLVELLNKAGIPPDVQSIIYRIILVCVLIYGFLWFLEKLYILLKPLLSKIRLPSHKEKLERIYQRQKLAEILEYEIKHICELEEWNDREFVELEAEVEAEGSWIRPTWIPFWKQERHELHIEASLTQALGTSTERLIVLQGEAGSGKSVALRHVGLMLAGVARSSRDLYTILPVYINLKELIRTDGQKIDHFLIRNFVCRSLNRMNDSEIGQILEDEFDRGIRSGTWLFLFDSFDEIPEILSATNVDQNIRAYSSAISDFMYGLNECRGIIASRSFRGPQSLNWPRFTILGLSGERRLKLIQTAGLDSEMERAILEGVSNASDVMVPMFSNPLFMALLCEYMRVGRAFPENVHMVFETYVTTRLNHDRPRMSSAYNVEPDEVRKVAEQVAFIMVMNETMGLTPTRPQLKFALREEKFKIPRYFDRALDALEFLKLAHGGMHPNSSEKVFMFTHRRIQEYFATCLVLQNPERVSARQLLLRGRWRETAVTLLQTQLKEHIQALLEEAEKLTDELLAGQERLIADPLAYIASASEAASRKELRAVSLPEELYHVFGLLQDGLGSQRVELPVGLIQHASQALLTAYEYGPLYEKTWALSVSGVVYELVLLYMLRNAFASRSMLLLDTAFQRVSHLRVLPREVIQSIKKMLHDSAAQEFYRLSAYVKRLPPNWVFQEILKISSNKRYNKRTGDFILETIARVSVLLAVGLFFAFGLQILLFFLHAINLPQPPAFELAAWFKTSFRLFIVLGLISFSSFFVYWLLLYHYDRILSPVERPFALLIYLYYNIQDYIKNGGLDNTRTRFAKEVEQGKVMHRTMLKYDFYRLAMLSIPVVVVMCLLTLLLPDLTRAAQDLNSQLEQIPYLSALLSILLAVMLLRLLKPVLPGVFAFYLSGLLETISEYYFSIRDPYFNKWMEYAEQKTLSIYSFDELKTALGDFGDSAALARFLRTIRRNQLITLSPEMAKSLADYSLRIETIAPTVTEKFRLKKDKFYDKDVVSYRVIVAQFTELKDFIFSHEPETGLRHPIFYNNTVEVVDELNAMINQVRFTPEN